MKHKVSIVLTHHLNRNQHYLDLALKSLLAQVDVDLEIILVASCIEDPIVPEGVKVIRVPHTTLTAPAYTMGVAAIRPDSTFFMIANDDIIVSKYTVAHMTQACWNENAGQPQPVILNCLSNDGFGMIHFTHPMLKHPSKLEFLPMISEAPFEKVLPYYDVILNTHRVSQDVITINTVNCFYFTMIPRRVWELVGGLDLEICGKNKSSHEDVDFCMRAKSHGIACIQTFGGFVWHFGGASVKHTMTHEDRVIGRQAYCGKWNIPYETFSIPNPT